MVHQKSVICLIIRELKQTNKKSKFVERVCFLFSRHFLEYMSRLRTWGEICGEKQLEFVQRKSADFLFPPQILNPNTTSMVLRNQVQCFHWKIYKHNKQQSDLNYNNVSWLLRSSYKFATHGSPLYLCIFIQVCNTEKN